MLEHILLQSFSKVEVFSSCDLFGVWGGQSFSIILKIVRFQNRGILLELGRSLVVLALNGSHVRTFILVAVNTTISLGV